ncbi:glycosyltransferase [Flavobacterium sp.]|uniref:glycosyltransferase n=1 Tax=Flavobacterium sp. TaxID=239 RepID=UPI0037508774
MKLSIIIPVFNVEKYIAKCIDSIITQQIQPNDYEIIIVNDGSPDNSKNIIEEYKKKYPQIVFINQENQGVSVARNKGLDVAKGKYILFIDPDDAVHENSIHKILEVATTNDLDILYLSLELYDEANNYLYLYKKCGEEGTISNGIIHPRRTFPATLYKKETIGKIRFFKGITRGQDSVFNAMVQSVALKCSYCSIPYYKYLQRETSSRQFVGNDKAFKGCLIAIKELENYKNENFPEANNYVIDYFDKVKLIFLQRAIEWNIMPNLDKNRFIKVKLFLKENNLNSLATTISSKFKFFNTTYFQFYCYHYSLKIFYSILAFLSKTKRKLFN